MVLNPDNMERDFIKPNSRTNLKCNSSNREEFTEKKHKINNDVQFQKSDIGIESIHTLAVNTLTSKTIDVIQTASTCMH